MTGRLGVGGHLAHMPVMRQPPAPQLPPSSGTATCPAVTHRVAAQAAEAWAVAQRRSGCDHRIASTWQQGATPCGVTPCCGAVRQRTVISCTWPAEMNSPNRLHLSVVHVSSSGVGMASGSSAACSISHPANSRATRRGRCTGRPPFVRMLTNASGDVTSRVVVHVNPTRLIGPRGVPYVERVAIVVGVLELPGVCHRLPFPSLPLAFPLLSATLRRCASLRTPLFQFSRTNFGTPCWSSSLLSICWV